MLQGSDELLQAFLKANTEPDADRELHGLLDRVVTPVVVPILRHRLGITPDSGREQRPEQIDYNEVESDIRIQVITRLQQLRTDPASAPIHDLKAFASRVAHNEVNGHWRALRPRRFSLENSLRYALTHRPGLAFWRDAGGEWIGGFSVWRDRGAAPAATARLRQLRENPEGFARAALEAADVRNRDPGREIAAVLDRAGHPLALDDLVTVFAAAWGVKDAPVDSLMDEKHAVVGYSDADTVPEEVLGRLDLRRYWLELCKLPPRSCASLLLHARDPNGNSILELLRNLAVASVDEMARAMSLAREQLDELWAGIPMEDARIAELLGVTAQHVARMRMNGRRTVAERMRCEAGA